MDRGDDLVAGADESRTTGKIPQEAEFREREREIFIVHENSMPGRVDHQAILK